MELIVCRKGCGACCIAPSISSPLPGMTKGKPAGVPCVNLTSDFSCSLWGKPNFPKVCRDFTPQRWVCGDAREDALGLITSLEIATRPD